MTKQEWQETERGAWTRHDDVAGCQVFVFKQEERFRKKWCAHNATGKGDPFQIAYGSTFYGALENLRNAIEWARE